MAGITWGVSTSGLVEDSHVKEGIFFFFLENEGGDLLEYSCVSRVVV